MEIYISNMMIKQRQLAINLFVLLFGFNSLNAQTQFEFGYSCGANATTSRTLKSENMTWGYYTPPIPSTWLNSFSSGFTHKRINISLLYDSGALGPTWVVKGYTNKYPLQNYDNSEEANMSIATSFQARSRANTNLSRISLVFKGCFYISPKSQHKILAGFGYFKTRIVNDSGDFRMSFFDDSLGWVTSGMVLDKYEYLRTNNYYLTFGYEYCYALGYNFLINVGLKYNQGSFKMIRWHTYRTYSESYTGYSEYDSQWSFTRLSHFSFTIGLSYSINLTQNCH
jgi:hypothetical protein